MLPFPPPMIELRAAANAEWKFGSDVIALVAAAIVSSRGDDNGGGGVEDLENC